MSPGTTARSAHLLLLPFLACFLLFWLVPLLGGVRMSLFSNTLYGEADYVGLQHYLQLLSDPRYFKALSNNLIYTAASLILILPLALALAHLVRASFPRVRPVLTFTLLLPGLTPPTVLALLFLLFFHGRDGMLNAWFVTPLGFKAINWIKDPDFIMPALVLQTVWRWTGFITFFILAGMETIPRTLYEATSLLTTRHWDHFRFVTLPALRPVLLFSAVYLVIDAFSLFSGSYILLGGSGGTSDAGLLLVSYTYENFNFGRLGTAAAISTSIAPLLLLTLWFCFIRQKRRPS